MEDWVFYPAETPPAFCGVCGEVLTDDTQTLTSGYDRITGRRLTDVIQSIRRCEDRHEVWELTKDRWYPA